MAHVDVEVNERPPWINMVETATFIANVMNAKEKGLNVTLKESVHMVCDFNN
jgi:hypothetical protein